jgi:hypothetical protein
MQWVKMRHGGLLGPGPVYPCKQTLGGCAGMSGRCRLCCKSRKLQGDEFFAKTRSGNQSPIRITSIALPNSPVSLTLGDEVPHIFTRKLSLLPAELLITSAKRLLQHNLPIADIVSGIPFRKKPPSILPEGFLATKLNQLRQLASASCANQASPKRKDMVELHCRRSPGVSWELGGHPGNTR